MLADYFEAVLSAEDAGELKPAAIAYEYAAKKCAVTTNDILTVAAHTWDIAGAAAANCETAFIRRPLKALNPAAEPPRFEGRNLIEVARQIIGAS